MDDLDGLIGKYGIPISEVIRKSDRIFLLVLDSRGGIVHSWHEEYLSNGGLILPRLRECGDIFECFDFGGEKDLSRIADSGKGFPFRHELVNRAINEEFFTVLPLCILQIRALKDRMYLGVGKITGLLPNIFNPGLGQCIVYVSRDDRLQGFNKNFYEFFRTSYETPSGMLDLPCGNFFSPTPQQIQNDHFSGVKPDLERPVPFFQLREGAFNKKEAETNSPGCFAGPSPFSPWKNDGPEPSYLTVLKTLDLTRQDFSVDLSFDRVSGFLPLVLLGGRCTSGVEPDDEGYGFGTSYSAPGGRPFIKKYGFHTAESLEKPDIPAGPCRFTLIKKGEAFFFLINGKQVLRYYDFEPFKSPETCLSLGLRPRSSANIKSLRIAVAPCPGSGRRDILVRLNTAEETYFTLNRFYNTSLSANYPAMTGYLMRDITRLLEDAKKYQAMYRSEQAEVRRLSKLLGRSPGEEGLFLGDSSATTAVREKAGIIADGVATVLIEGETGTGKEVLARYIHWKSPFSRGPFVKVDCSTLPESLVESELFGYEKGAFTGAYKDKKGKFEQANKGTLFLDEVNNLSPGVQAKLLGFLQDFTLTRVGGVKPVQLDLRIVIASNVPLGEMVQKGLFREDLFYRIKIVSIELPPLRSRPDDIPVLCRHFLEQACEQNRKTVKGLTPAAFEKLYAHAWPGNVRELKNVIFKAVIFCDRDEIGASLLEIAGPAKRGASKTGGKKKVYLPDRKFISMLKRHKGNINQMAAALGLSRQTVYNRIERLGVDREDFRPGRKA